MSSQIILTDIDALRFDSFSRDARRDVVCLAPIRTVIRREEENILVRKVRKVEEIDASPACPIGSTSLSSDPIAAPNSQPAYAYQA